MFDWWPACLLTSCLHFDWNSCFEKSRPSSRIRVEFTRNVENSPTEWFSGNFLWRAWASILIFFRLPRKSYVAARRTDSSFECLGVLKVSFILTFITLFNLKRSRRFWENMRQSLSPLESLSSPVDYYAIFHTWSGFFILNITQKNSIKILSCEPKRKPVKIFLIW